MDQPTIKKIATLHPSVRTEVTQIVNECNAALKGRAQLRLTQCLRTFKEQDALYAQPTDGIDNDRDGRVDEKDECVTRAKGGQSVHNYGFAVDGVLLIDGKAISWDFKKDWDADGVADWDEIVRIFARHGWSWGGSWTSFKDMPHFEKIGFNNWRLLSQKKLDPQGYVIL